MNRRLIRGLITSVLITLLAACSGNGGGTTGIDGSGKNPSAASGPINGFGSVIVNGVRYNTDDAEIFVGNEPVAEEQLDVGDYVTVVGRKSKDGLTGTATHVYYHPNVKGPISSISLDQNTVTVLGQTLRLATDTTFGSEITPRNIQGLKVGDIVEASGPRDATNRIGVTRIDVAPVDALEITGLVSGLNHETQSLFVNGIEVNFATSGFTGSVVDGASILVEGNNFENNVLYADSVQALSDYRDLDLANRPQIEHFGFITEFNSINDFSVGGFRISTNNDSEIINNSGAPIGLNSRVRLIGHFNSENILESHHMEVLVPSELKISGEIANLTENTANAEILGYVSVQGIETEIQTGTRISNATGDTSQRLYFTDLRLGDYVTIIGFQQNNQFIATALEHESVVTEDMAQIIIGSPFNINIGAQQFEMYDVVVVWDDNTTIGINNGDDDIAEIIHESQNLEVSGIKVNNTFYASTIKLHTAD